MSPAKKVIIDADVGTDDALALLVLLHAEREGLVKIEAICCTMGNTAVDNVCRNVLRILEVLGRNDIPVYKGASTQMIQPRHAINQYHGIDGFGDLKHKTDPDDRVVQPEPAAVGMYNIGAKHPGEIHLVCLGPLTNVALAMKLYANFADLIKEIHLMGGNYKATGNVTSTAEYNFYIDPEAAHIVLHGAKCPVVVLPWETCLESNFTFDWRFDVLGKSEDPVMRLLNEAERSVYRDRTEESWLPCDAFVAVAFAYPESVEKESGHHATVELHGHETRGQIVLDHLKREKPNVRIIELLNEEFFRSILLKSAGHN